VAVAGIVHALRMPRAKGAMFDVWLRFARWMMAALLAASGIWVAISPKADQPVLDALERAFPAIRSAYMDNDAVREPATLRRATLQAREKNRYWIGGVMVLLALSLVVSLPSSRTRPRNFGG
jgi:phosphoribosyl-AMP cyclohydrolase